MDTTGYIGLYVLVFLTATGKNVHDTPYRNIIWIASFTFNFSVMGGGGASFFYFNKKVERILFECKFLF